MCVGVLIIVTYGVLFGILVGVILIHGKMVVDLTEVLREEFPYNSQVVTRIAKAANLPLTIFKEDEDGHN